MPILLPLNQVDGFIQERLLKTKAPLIPEVTSYILSSGGKRLRPRLTLLCALLYDAVFSKESIAMASSVELIHTATLLHDDVVDEAKTRRNQLCAHHHWDAKTSILVGDFLFAEAFRIIVDYGGMQSVDIISQTACDLSEGEILQLTHGYDLTTSCENYEFLIRLKTASLFSAACSLGLLSVKKEKEIAMIQSIGHNLGMAFQIRDDVDDYESNNESGQDFCEGKVTLPVILSQKNAPECSSFWKEHWGVSLDSVREHIRSTKGFEDSLIYREKFLNQAKHDLMRFPESKARSDLLDLCN